VERTLFFRHPKQFELLADIALPQVTAKNADTKKLRIWSAGCATGQEAYSIAMVLGEFFEGKEVWDIKILATDIDTNALKTAYKGQYAEDSMREIPREYVDKYFEKKGEFCSVEETLRKKILFRRLNFMEPSYPFRSLVDILFCRNVMIYFDMEVRKKLISNLFSILQPEGFLFLGSSESLIGVDDRFSLIDHAAYQKTG
jgi:chemotaxis protein methyltransferase CheR